MRNCWYTCAFFVHEWKTVETNFEGEEKLHTSIQTEAYVQTRVNMTMKREKRCVEHFKRCYQVHHQCASIHHLSQYDTTFEFITLQSPDLHFLDHFHSQPSHFECFLTHSHKEFPHFWWTIYEKKERKILSALCLLHTNVASEKLGLAWLGWVLVGSVCLHH